MGLNKAGSQFLPLCRIQTPLSTLQTTKSHLSSPFRLLAEQRNQWRNQLVNQTNTNSVVQLRGKNSWIPGPIHIDISAFNIKNQPRQQGSPNPCWWGSKPSPFSPACTAQVLPSFCMLTPLQYPPQGTFFRGWHLGSEREWHGDSHSKVNIYITC